MVSCVSLIATVVAGVMVAAGIAGAFTSTMKQKDGGDSRLYLYQYCDSGSGECTTYDRPPSGDCDRRVYDRFTTAFALALIGSVLGVAVVIVSCVGALRKVPGMVGILIDLLCAASFIVSFVIIINLYREEFCPNAPLKTSQFSDNYNLDMGFAFLVVAAALALFCVCLHAVSC